MGIGQSCGDLHLNVTVNASSVVKVGDEESVKCFFLSSDNYDRLLSVHMTNLAQERMDFF